MFVITVFAYLVLLCSSVMAIPTATQSEKRSDDASALQARNTVWNGAATYYYQGGVAGSCGQYSSDYDMVVAISSQSPFAPNAHCGQTVTISNTGGGQQNNGVGKKIVAWIVDTCVDCVNSHLGMLNSTGILK